MEIAVIIPCHSWPKYLTEAVWSVTQQTCPVDQILILDHPENKWDYTGRTYTYVQAERKGVSAARNLGFEIAKERGYKWVIPLDEDDFLWPRYVERMETSLKLCPDAGIHYSDWTIFTDDISFRDYHRTPEYYFDRLLQGPFIISAAMISIATWETVKAVNGTGYDEKLTDLGLKWEDYLFYLEAGALGIEMTRVGLGLVKVRRHPGSRNEDETATREQWYDYTEEKLERLYGTVGIRRLSV